MNPTVMAAAIGVGGTIVVGVAGFWATVRATGKTIRAARPGVLVTYGTPPCAIEAPVMLTSNSTAAAITATSKIRKARCLRDGGRGW